MCYNENMKEFGEVETIVQRLYAKIAPIFTNTYGRGMTNKIGLAWKQHYCECL